MCRAHHLSKRRFLAEPAVKYRNRAVHGMVLIVVLVPRKVLELGW